MCDDSGMPGRCGCPTRPTFPPRPTPPLIVALVAAGLVAAAYGACAVVLVPAAACLILENRR